MPSQLAPFVLSKNPSSQVQLYEPTVFRQYCSQGFCSHSLMSTINNYMQIFLFVDEQGIVELPSYAKKMWMWRDILRNLPSQVTPSAFSRNPSSQVQLKEPTVFIHCCSQRFCSHSLMSTINNYFNGFCLLMNKVLLNCLHMQKKCECEEISYETYHHSWLHLYLVRIHHHKYS